MTACVPADDTYLTTVWPGVVVRTGERWLVTVDAGNVTSGAYTVSIQGLPFTYTAEVPPDDATAIRGGLQTALGGQLFAAVMASGTAGLVLQEVVPAPPAQPGGLVLAGGGPGELGHCPV